MGQVVLPAVARKKGLDDQYQTTDGSPKPRKPEPKRPEPVRFYLWHLGAIQLMTFLQAPGTFGYDYSKYRPPRDGEPMPNGIEMDEFGNRKSVLDTNPPREEKWKEDPPSTTAAMIEDKRPIVTMKQNGYVSRPSPPPSPPPFSHYTPQSPPGAKPVSSQNIHPVEEEEDRSGGCCKCVIM